MAKNTEEKQYSLQEIFNFIYDEDERNIEIQRPLLPAKPATARTLDTTISSSTEITLNANTRWIRVISKTQDAYMKWGTADVTNANFDHYILAGQVFDFKVPVETGSTLYTAVNFLEQAASATLIVTEY